MRRSWPGAILSLFCPLAVAMPDLSVYRNPVFLDFSPLLYVHVEKVDGRGDWVALPPESAPVEFVVDARPLALAPTTLTYAEVVRDQGLPFLKSLSMKRTKHADPAQRVRVTPEFLREMRAYLYERRGHDLLIADWVSLGREGGQSLQSHARVSRMKGHNLAKTDWDQRALDYTRLRKHGALTVFDTASGAILGRCHYSVSVPLEPRPPALAEYSRAVLWRKSKAVARGQPPETAALLHATEVSYIQALYERAMADVVKKCPFLPLGADRTASPE